MFNIAHEVITWGHRKLTLETGRIARQAHGAVVVAYGDTAVLATVVADHNAKPDVDFLPLTVNYQEKTYAVGKIPGNYFRREGRPSEREVLVSRLIDRPLRPLFSPHFHNETQVLVTVLSYDLENDPDVVSIIAASAALQLAGLPVAAPVAAARVGYSDGAYVLNPPPGDARSELDLVVAGTHDGVLMVESEASGLSEEEMIGALRFGHESFGPVLDAITRLKEQAGKPAWNVEAPQHGALETSIADGYSDKIVAAYQISDKIERHAALSALRSAAVEAHDDADHSKASAINGIFKSLEKKTVRGSILSTGQRIDGRDLETVRPIHIDVSLLPRAHGTALFTRGETQALAIATLGTGEDEQYVDSLDGTYKENFLLHYNFPPYSVGEVGRSGFTSRREVGHGKLAWRALRSIMPSKEKFPYTIRVVSEVTESNGSSSMASVCGASLALMDAGVPIDSPVAGIAMGLILEGEDFAILSDILGDEDHLGDMDFKVAGTRDGITALQMDIKVIGVTAEIMRNALAQARQGRLQILDIMANAMPTVRNELDSTVPRIEVLNIPVDKIRDVIGTGGKVIRAIVNQTGAKIDIADDGTVKIAAANPAAIQEAIQEIYNITAEPEVGKVYDGTVVKVVEFGAFVNLFGKRDGLVHISQIAPHRITKVRDFLNEGDQVKVKLLGFDERGKIRLSMKNVDQRTGEVTSGGY